MWLNEKQLETHRKHNLGANLGAARQGTYGGARQLLAQTERERALGQQLGRYSDSWVAVSI
jgi:hypothetical protein